MSNEGHLDQEWSPQEFTGLLDSLKSAERMRAIGAAMQQYFGTMDWVKARNIFPGLAKTK